MGRKGIEAAEVEEAALAVLERGENPSVDRVRKQLGNTGSKTTINMHLQAWRKEYRHDINRRVLSNIPEELSEPVQTLWQCAVEYASQKLEGEQKLLAERDEVLAERERTLAAVQPLLEDKISKQEDLLSKMQDKLAENEKISAEQELILGKLQEAHTAMRENYEYKVEQLTADRDEAHRRAQLLENELAELKKNHEQRVQSLEATHRAACDRYEAGDSRWSKLVDDLRQELRENKRENEAVRQESACQVEQLSSSLNAERAKRIKAETKVEQQEKLLSEQRKAISEMQHKMMSATSKSKRKTNAPNK